MKHQDVYLSILTDNIEDGVLFVDRHMNIIDLNPVACQLLKWQRENVIDRSYQTCQEQLPESHRVLGDQLQQCITEQREVAFQQALVVTRELSHIVAGTVYPLFEQGQLMGAIAIFRPAPPEEDAERLQADFIAMASHNLRTPLMSIQMALDFVLDSHQDLGNNTQHLRQARIQSQKIASFLQELLSIAQLTQNRQIPLKIKPTNLEQVVESVMHDLGQGHSNIQYDLKIPPGFAQLLTDEGKVFVIVQNLIAYVRNRCTANEKLKIIIEEQQTEVIVSIIDNGPPLPVEQYQQIFWQVYPLEAGSQSRDYLPYGYSIGLFGIRRLVELLGGRIWVSQVQEAGAASFEGTSLNFTLPVRREFYATNLNN